MTADNSLLANTWEARLCTCGITAFTLKDRSGLTSSTGPSVLSRATQVNDPSY